MDPIEVLLRLAATLDQQRIAYFVGGSVVSSYHGVPRASRDADVVARVLPPHAAPLAAALSSSFLVEEDAIREAARDRSSFQVVDREELFKIDVFVLRDDDFQLAELERSRPYPVGSDPSASLRMVTPEDIVVQKLVWYRAGGGLSDQQWADVVGVLRVQGTDLDRAYVRSWALRLGLADLLDRALAEST